MKDTSTTDWQIYKTELLTKHVYYTSQQLRVGYQKIGVKVGSSNFIFSTFIYDYIQSLEDYLNAVSASSDAASASIVMLHLLPLLLLCIFALFRMGCFISGIILFILNRKKFVLTAYESDLEKGQQFKTVILNPGMLLFSIFWIVMIIWQLIR